MKVYFSRILIPKCPPIPEWSFKDLLWSGPIWSPVWLQEAAEPPEHDDLASHRLTSLEGTREPFLRDHQLSTMAMRQESTTPAARTQKTPAKLWMSRALLRCRVCTELYRSQGLSLGHHFSFSMSMSPFCCSSKILRVQRERKIAEREQRSAGIKTTHRDPDS